MSFAARFVRSAVAALLTLPLVVSAQVRTTARPEVRVLSKVDSAMRTTLTGNMPASVANAAVGTRLASSTQLDHVMLLLQPSGEQDAALRTLLDAQQDKNSPLFHKWLTPDTFAQSFGVADADIAKVTNWLQDSGLSIEQVSHSKRVILFSGTVGAVEAAFSTELHNVTVAGEAHISNTTEISVPMALSSVIRGLVRLNNFFPKTDAHFVSTLAEEQAKEAAQGGPVAPNYGGATGTHYVSPGDVATIFNAKPLTTASTPIDGTGVTIAVLARSNIDLGDVATFRSMFGLPAKNPTITVVGIDPGKNGDDGEAYLDAEWAGAVAPNANINFIVNTASLISGGVDGAALYSVDNNIGDIISLSYGGCEVNNGVSGTAFYNVLWQQAAAQGQTAFVSSGDSGAAGCDSSSASYAAGGYGVNALGSSAYNVAVGGSMFVDFGQAQYWGATGGTTIPFVNALSYIPEAALNQGRLSSTYLNSASSATQTGSGIFSAGGGISLYTARPSWQTGSGISASADPTDYQGNAVPLTGTTVSGLHRIVPDLSLISASGHVGTLYCAGAICRTTSSGGLANAGIVGGTSVATPVMASAQALINQKNGGRQGNTNIYYYKLANTQYTASTTACQATNGTASVPAVTLPAATCNFQDITAGNIVVPTASSGSAGIGYAASAGFDAATGLGSVNIANVANNWSTVTFNATGTTLTLTPTEGITHGTNQTATVRVTPASGTGTPTGDVSIIASQQTAYGSPQLLTLSGGSATATINSLPAGTYTVYAHYAGDSTFASSDSAPVTVTIARENSAVSLNNYSITTGGDLVATSGFAYASSTIYIDTQIAGASGTGTPGGSVTFAVSRNGSAIAPLTTTLDTYGTTYLQSGPGFASYYLVPNYATLTPGSYAVTANYSGDSSFNASSATTTFVVTRVIPTVTFLAQTTQIASGQQATLNFSIATPTSAAAAATGTVTFVDTTTSSTLGTATLFNGSASFNTTAITSSSGHNITATYSGDVNYTSTTVMASVTVGTGTAPTVTVSSSGTLTVGATVTLTATLSTAPVTSSTVSFFDNGVLIGSSPISTTTASRTIANFSAGTHPITAVFSGNSTQTASTSAVTNVTIAKNTTGVNITAGTVSQAYGNVAVSVSVTRSPTTSTVPPVPLTGPVNFYDTSVSPSALVGTATPGFDPSGYGTYTAATTITSLAPGTHTISAVYAGDANYNSATSANTPTFTITKGNPGVSAVPASAVYGTSTATLTANVSFGGPVSPTGAVTLRLDNGAAIAATCTGSASPLVCTASYNTAALAGGAHTLTASYAGDTNYNAATGTASFTIGKASPAVSVTTQTALAGTSTPVSATITFTGSAAPSGGVTIAVDSLAAVAATCSGSTSPVICTATYNTSSLPPGNHTITASLGTDANYVAASGSGTLTITSITTPITFTVANHTYGDASFAVSASSASSGAFTYSVVSGPATISGNTVTLTGVGTVTLQASQAASGSYNANTQTTTFAVAKGAATIAFMVPTHTYGDAPFTVSATSVSSGAFIYSVVSGPATISGNTVTLTGAGSVVLQASQATDANYLANTQNVTFTVAAGSALITFTVPNHTYGDAPFAVSAASVSASAFAYTVVSGPATISGTMVTLTGAGTVTLQASQAASANYGAGTQNTSFIVAQGTAPITFTVPNHTYGDSPFTVTATSASTGAFSYSLVSGPATISGTTVTLTGAGSVVLQASQATDANYLANTQNVTFTVAAGSAPITFTVPNHTYGDSPFTVTATSASTGAFSYSVVSGPATISGNTVTLTGSGTVVLQASQAASGSYLAVSQTATFTVAKGTPTVTFQQPAAVPYGMALSSTQLAATALVAGTFVYTPAAGTVLGAGTQTLSVQFTPASTVNYNTPAAVTTTISVVPAVTTTTVTSSSSSSLLGAPVTFTATVAAATGPVPTGSVIFTDGTTTLATVTLTAGVATYSTTALTAGSHTIRAAYQSNGNDAASAGTVTQSVASAPFSLASSGSGSVSLTIVRGSSGSTTITVNPAANFSGTVTLSCSGLPATVSCYFFNPALTFTGTGTPQSSALRIDTYQLSSALRNSPAAMASPLGSRLTLSFLLPGLLLAGVGARSRKLHGSSRLMMLVFLLAGLAGAATLTGCGTSSSSNPAQAAAGTYTVNVVATSGATAQTLPITLTVQ